MRRGYSPTFPVAAHPKAVMASPNVSLPPMKIFVIQPYPGCQAIRVQDRRTGKWKPRAGSCQSRPAILKLGRNGLASEGGHEPAQCSPGASRMSPCVITGHFGSRHWGVLLILGFQSTGPVPPTATHAPPLLRWGTGGERHFWPGERRLRSCGRFRFQNRTKET